MRKKVIIKISKKIAVQLSFFNNICYLTHQAHYKKSHYCMFDFYHIPTKPRNRPTRFKNCY